MDLQSPDVWYHRLIPIHPNFVVKQGWDVMIMLLLLYSSFQVPYSMAFDDSDGQQSPAYVAEVLLDVIFMVLGDAIEQIDEEKLLKVTALKGAS